MSSNAKMRLKWLLIGAVLTSLCLFGTPTRVALSNLAHATANLFGSIAAWLR